MYKYVSKEGVHMDKKDLRVIKTEQALRNALLELGMLKILIPSPLMKFVKRH